MQKNLDFRSDTVTKPTSQMRQAMAAAEVGDDVYGDDPTVNRLEALAAGLLKKEAALFVPSGTMGNQLALFTHAQRGQEVIVSSECHIVQHEAGAAAIIPGVQLRCVPTQEGRYDMQALGDAVRKHPEDIHSPRTALICLENADGQGRVQGLEYMRDVRRLADKYNLPIHLDGARIFNAAARLKLAAADIAAYADSVMFCLSKGLCAPVGSMLAGSGAFVEQARRKRKIMGGGMRQTGILAAAGILALTDMKERLPEDHETALYMATQLTDMGMQVVPPHINMVFCRIENVSEQAFVARMTEQGVLINGQEDGFYRFVTHYGINREDIDLFVACVQKARQ